MDDAFGGVNGHIVGINDNVNVKRLTDSQDFCIRRQIQAGRVDVGRRQAKQEERHGRRNEKFSGELGHRIFYVIA